MIQSRWCGLAPEYRRFLAQAIVPDTVELEGVRVPGVDAMTLLELGVGDRAQPTAGEFIFQVNLNSMIAAGRFDDLRTWLLQIPNVTKDRDYLYLYRFCVDRNLGAAREEIEKAHQREPILGPALLLHSGYGMDEVASQYLREVIVRAKDVFLLSECARACKIILDDEGAARRTLALAEKAIAAKRSKYKPNLPSAWSVLAEVWKGNLADEVEAERCFLVAESRTRDSLYWHYCAELRHAYFGDAETARRLLLRSDKRDWWRSGHWVDCAMAWMSVLRDRREVLRCLRSAEEIAADFLDWGQCADGWKDIFNDLPQVLRCLDLSEARATRSDEWTYCAGSWKWLAGDTDRARRCMEAAGLTATSCTDWWSSARDWAVDLSDQKEARRCMEKAEALALTSWDWSTCAGTWISFLTDAPAAGRCMAEAERRASTTSAWCKCAKTWNDDFGDDGQARRCMAEAEGLAIGCKDWKECAEMWAHLEDKAAESRCRGKEKRAKLRLVRKDKPSSSSGGL